MPTYLPLTEYSSKYRVSISTLRRRIKAEDIQFLFEDGRYLILDEPMSTHQGHPRPSLDQTSDDSLVGASAKEPVHGLVEEPVQHQHMSGFQNRVVSEKAPGFNLSHSTASYDSFPKANPDEPVITAANRLLTELKKAYTQILHEKEEQILHLREEVADLKTLVRVLESDNERLAGRSRY